MEKSKNIDKPKFFNQSTFIVSGSSRSGKTVFVNKLLRNLETCFVKGAPGKILYCYSKIQEDFLKLETELEGFELHSGLPTIDKIKELASGDTELLLVLDDLIHDVLDSKEIADLFCTGRHLNLSIIFVTQNLLEKGKYSRAISLNACYIVLFRNLRDSNQVRHLGMQIYPGKVTDFMKIYNDVMKKTFQYLVIDLHPYSSDEYRLRTNIFDDEEMVIYQLGD